MCKMTQIFCMQKYIQVEILIKVPGKVGEYIYLTCKSLRTSRTLRWFLNRDQHAFISLA